MGRKAKHLRNEPEITPLLISRPNTCVMLGGVDPTTLWRLEAAGIFLLPRRLNPALRKISGFYSVDNISAIVNGTIEEWLAENAPQLVTEKPKLLERKRLGGRCVSGVQLPRPTFAGGARPRLTVVTAPNYGRDVDPKEAQRFLDLLGAKNCTFQTFDDEPDRKLAKGAITKIMHGGLTASCRHPGATQSAGCGYLHGGERNRPHGAQEGKHQAHPRAGARPRR